MGLTAIQILKTIGILLSFTEWGDRERGIFNIPVREGMERLPDFLVQRKLGFRDIKRSAGSQPLGFAHFFFPIRAHSNYSFLFPKTISLSF